MRTGSPQRSRRGRQTFRKRLERTRGRKGKEGSRSGRRVAPGLIPEGVRSAGEEPEPRRSLLVLRFHARLYFHLLVPAREHESKQEQGIDAAGAPKRAVPLGQARELEPARELRRDRKQGLGMRSEMVPGPEQEPRGVLEAVRPLTVATARVPERLARAKWQGEPQRP